MSDTSEEELEDAEEEVEDLIKNPADNIPTVGPLYPSGMSAPEAILAGSNMGLDQEQADAVRARLRGEIGEEVVEEEVEES